MRDTTYELKSYAYLKIETPITKSLFNPRFLRERLSVKPQNGISGFSLHFPKTLSLKEMGKFLWEGREKGLQN